MIIGFTLHTRYVNNFERANLILSSDSNIFEYFDNI